jgi:hypothetical protein
VVAKGIVISLAVILMIIDAAVFLRSRGGGTRRLSADEETMRSLVHEVYGDKITAESVSLKDGDALMTITLNDEKLRSLQVNLSSLARKHREQGLSLPVIKKSLEF